jgi:hypothetical protein
MADCSQLQERKEVTLGTLTAGPRTEPTHVVSTGSIPALAKNVQERKDGPLFM